MTPPRNHVLVGDALTELRRLPESSVDMVLTSPPYFRLRDYQIDGQLGLEAHVDQWVTGLRAVTQEVARVLVPTGSLWLNVADTYSTHQPQGAGRKSLLLGRNASPWHCWPTAGYYATRSSGRRPTRCRPRSGTG
jgi:site-specific DNA-methyltransferase (adenine-specific)